MGDITSSIVVKGINMAKATALADKAIKHLIAQKIILGEQTDCVLGKPLGYPPGENHGLVMEEESDQWLELRTNGLEITVGRNVYYANGIDSIECPNCEANIEETNWGDAMDAWVSESENDQVTCPECNQSRSVTELVFKPTWTFGELGFTFWNWGTPFNQSFIDEMETVLGHKVVIAYTKI